MNTKQLLLAIVLLIQTSCERNENLIGGECKYVEYIGKAIIENDKIIFNNSYVISRTSGHTYKTSPLLRSYQLNENDVCPAEAVIVSLVLNVGNVAQVTPVPTDFRY